MDACNDDWAVEEFRDVALGDVRLDRRLLTMARQAARRPEGRVTRVFGTSAEREAAFRFIENRSVKAAPIMSAGGRATARRCRNERVFVPLDTTVLTIADHGDSKGFGPVCGKAYYHRGAFVMSAIAVSSNGTTRGLLEQVWWTRSFEPSARGRAWKADRRPLTARVTYHWVEAMAASADRLAAEGAEPWFQMDRGADCYSVLTAIIDRGWKATLRSTSDRLCDVGKLSEALAAPSFMGACTIKIRRAPGREPRIAVVRLAASRVFIEARTPFQPARTLPFNVVEVVEMAPPRGVEPIHWRLLTTQPVRTARQVRAIIAGYTTRWHIETFHHAWKSGVTNVESSQLRDVERLKIWATFLAIVAARAERLKHRARTEPDVSALEELTQDEIDAVILLRRPRGIQPGTAPRLGDVVRWIAEYGGYTGKSSGGPPGTAVIARALPEIAAAARAIAAIRERSG